VGNDAEFRCLAKVRQEAGNPALGRTRNSLKNKEFGALEGVEKIFFLRGGKELDYDPRIDNFG